MKTDPRIACKNVRECLGWAVLHDGVAHPLMVLSGYAKWSLRFHDFTSHRAWPRVAAAAAPVILWSRRWGWLHVLQVTPGFFAVQHPTVRHKLVVTADDALHAAEQADVWFMSLNDQLGGGEFSPVNDATPV